MVDELRILLDAADVIGRITEVHTDGDWIPGVSRVSIKGSTKSGKNFSLSLEVGDHDRSES